MKIFYVIMLSSVCFYACSNNASVDKNRKSNKTDITELRFGADSLNLENSPLIVFSEKTYDFGKVKKETGTISVDFNFENSGESSLIIYKVDVSCGCLTPQYPQQPIMPGEKGCINITINTNNQTGQFNKTVFVKSNAKNNVELLRIKGNIK